MNPEQLMVRKFHLKFGFTINLFPVNIGWSLGWVRFKHILSEMWELLIAIWRGDLVKIADALGDLLYFIYGTGVAYGIDLEPIFAEIHRSNMTKTPPNRSTGKAIKGVGYSPPDIVTIIKHRKRST